MKTFVVGDEPIEATIVGGIHGDEPCGPSAIRRFVTDPPDVDGGVKCIIANEQALARETRYIDEDLNRVFPGELGSDVHERDLASRLLEETADAPVLSLHSTRSTDKPFAIFDGRDDRAWEIVQRLPVDHLVDGQDNLEGEYMSAETVIDMECGRQGSQEAADNAYDLIHAFLTVVGVLGGEVGPTDADVYRMKGRLPKDPNAEYTVHVENFEPVPEGTVVARSTAGEEIIAPEPFVPVLLSANGYKRILGCMAQECGPEEYR